MGDAPKSAYEIAMERLRAQDKTSGTTARKLTAAQKDQIAEIRRFYEAKLAEREILYKGERLKVEDDAEKLRATEAGYATDRRRLESDRDSKIARIRE